MFAKEIGTVDLRPWTDALQGVSWKVAQGRDYQTAFIPAPQGYSAAFFLKLPPHTDLHRHVDAGDRETEHIVVQTNPQALNWWVDANGEHFQHLQAGRRYVVDRTVEHWATNHGETDRIHLILERA